MMNRVYDAAGIQLYQGDALMVLRTLLENSVDAVACDPPYGIGFMGKDWDHGVPGEAFWREAGRVLKPGGHLLAFGGTRTFHRLMCAIEDAEFEIRDCLCWLFGQGYPKSKNLDGVWKGFGTALKPAFEPIVLARKPLSEPNIAANVLKWGTGALNIDGCRIEVADGDERTGGFGQGKRPWQTGNVGSNTVRNGAEEGRWPANVALDEEAAAMLDAQTGELRSGQPCGMKAGNNNRVYGQFAGGIPVTGFGDAGGASRFYYCSKADRAERNAGLDCFPKQPLHRPSGAHNPGSFQSEGTEKAAQNYHPTVKPIALMQWLVRLVTPPGGVVLDHFMGSGSTGLACIQEAYRFIGIEQDPGYVEIAVARIRHAQGPLMAMMAEPTESGTVCHEGSPA